MRTKRHSVGKVRPHPVLGNGNDFPKESFRTVVEISQEDGLLTIGCEFVCDSGRIRRLVEEGRASFVADVNCPSIPGSRRNFSSGEHKAKFVVPASQTSKEISVAAYVVANDRIADYAPEGMHADYGGRKFKVLKHEILAQDEEGTKFFDLEGGDSFLKVRKSSDPHETIAKWEESSDHFWVVLPMDDFDNWMAVKGSSPQKDENVASPSFVLPAVIDAIGRLRDEGRGDLHGDDAPKWAKSLLGVLSELRIDLESCEPYEAAQRILKCPIGRVLANVLDPQEGED